MNADAGLAFRVVLGVVAIGAAALSWIIVSFGQHPDPRTLGVDAEPVEVTGWLHDAFSLPPVSEARRIAFDQLIAG